jgi:signal transduction histidine kinase
MSKGDPVNTDFETFMQTDPDPGFHQEGSAQRRRVKKLEEALRLRQELSAQRIRKLEKQRTELAREMYDNLGQMLAALQLNTALLAMENRDNAPLVARTTTMEQIIQTSIDTVQRISSELHPVMFDLPGLADAIEWQAHKFQTSSGIPCATVTHTAARQVPGDTATAVYRIFEKALDAGICLSNVTNIKVTLMENDGWLTLSVRHDMHAPDKADIKEFGRLAYAIMCEYAEAFGGQLRILETQESSITLLFRIPIR